MMSKQKVTMATNQDKYSGFAYMWLPVILFSLEAMREPSEDLLEIGARAASQPADWRLDDVLAYDQCDAVMRQEWRHEIAAAVDAMIDTALAEGESA